MIAAVTLELQSFLQLSLASGVRPFRAPRLPGRAL